MWLQRNCHFHVPLNYLTRKVFDTLRLVFFPDRLILSWILACVQLNTNHFNFFSPGVEVFDLFFRRLKLKGLKGYLKILYH